MALAVSTSRTTIMRLSMMLAISVKWMATESAHGFRI